MFFEQHIKKKSIQQKGEFFSVPKHNANPFFAPAPHLIQAKSQLPDNKESNSLIDANSFSMPTVQKFSLSDIKDGIGDAIDYVRGRPERERPEQERPEREKETKNPDDTPANYCKPYTNRAELWASRAYARATLLPASAGMFGAEVAGMWRQYLNGGGSRTFNDGSNIANAFKQSAVMRSHANRLMDIALTRLDRFSTIPANTVTDVPVENIFTSEEINFPLDFNNPFDIPGHIAGGASADGSSSSNFGPDTRKLKGKITALREEDVNTGLSRLSLTADFEFEVHDAMDFCPGNPGAFLEQTLTVPLSRLEASGDAGDVGLDISFKIADIRRRVDTGLGGPNTTPLPNNSDSRHHSDRRDVATILS